MFDVYLPPMFADSFWEDMPPVTSPWFWIGAVVLLCICASALAALAGYVYVYSLKWRMFGSALDYLERDDRDERPRRKRRRRRP